MFDMVCMNYDHNKKFGLLKFNSGYGKMYFNSPKGYSRKIINAQTAENLPKIAPPPKNTGGSKFEYFAGMI